jgi:hypothetical protein
MVINIRRPSWGKAKVKSRATARPLNSPVFGRFRQICPPRLPGTSDRVIPRFGRSRPYADADVVGLTDEGCILIFRTSLIDHPY